MPSGTGQTVQAPVPARFVVGFSDDVPAYLLRQVDFLDTGNGVGLGLAITAANAVVASAQNPGCEVLILDGTIDLDAAGALTTPYSLADGVTLRGACSARGGTSTTIGVQILGRSAVGADQGIFTVSGTGIMVTLRHMRIVFREPLGATVGSTIGVNLGASSTSVLEDMQIEFSGTLDTTEASNLDMRTGVAMGGTCNRVLINANGWKIRQFIAADFTVLALSIGNELTHENLAVSGGDIAVTCPGAHSFVGCAFTVAYSDAFVTIGEVALNGELCFTDCRFSGGNSAAGGSCFRYDPAVTASVGPVFVGCIFHSSGAGTDIGINILSTGGRSVLRTQIIGCSFPSLNTAISLGANATDTQIVNPTFGSSVTTAIIDAGINTTGSKHGMTWRGTFIAGAGATTAYAGMGEANAEMLAANAQKLFPATPGVAFRLRVQVISNSMPANTVFTVMLDTGATALTVTVGAAATGQFVDTDSVVFVAAAAASFTTWDLRVVETGVGTIVFSATLELI